MNSGGIQRLVMCDFHQAAATGDSDQIFCKLAVAQPGLNLRSESIAQALRRIAAEAAAPGFASVALIEAMVTSATIDLLRLCGHRDRRGDVARGGLAPWQIRRIEEALREMDGAAPTVAALAELVGITPRHMLRSFRLATGSTVVRYIAKARFSRACGLLTGSDLSLKQVAYKSGFATASAFAAAFKREARETPGEFRMRGRSRL